LVCTRYFAGALNRNLLIFCETKKLKYGINLRRIRSEAVGNFLYRITDFKQALNDYKAADNSAIKDKLGELFDDNFALVRDYHRRRR
jgi:hypothetical protein